MAQCEFVEACPFFNDRLQVMPGVSKLLKKQYCQQDFKSCARYRVRGLLGKASVPEDLFPHDQERGDEILAQSEKVAS